MKSEIAEPLKQAVIDTPIEYLILETDGPFVKPERPKDIIGKKWKKSRNTSLIIPAVAAEIAELKGMMLEDVFKAAEDNTRRIFNL